MDIKIQQIFFLSLATSPYVCNTRIYVSSAKTRSFVWIGQGVQPPVAIAGETVWQSRLTGENNLC